MRRNSGSLLLAAALFVTAPARTAVEAEAMMIERTPGSIAAEADLIVEGTVRSLAGHWSDEPGKGIVTDVTVDITLILAGDGIPGTAVVLEVAGGEIPGENIGVRVSDQPLFEVGEETRLFLRKGPRTGAFSTVSKYQGKLRLGGSRGAPRPGTPPSFQGGGPRWAEGKTALLLNRRIPGAALMPLARGGLAWNRAGAGFRFTYAGRTGRTTGRTFSYDGVNVITATDKGPAGGTLATNYYWYRPDTGELLDSDIEFNSYYAWSLSGQAGRFDVQSVACHELGHSLVLLDLYSSADSEKTMYGYAAPGETKKRTLHQDDIEGIRSIYP